MARPNPESVLSRLYESLTEKLGDEQMERVKQAVIQAQVSHRQQKRDAGEPYIIHPLRVALNLVVELGVHDTDMICAALLHDTLEDDPRQTADSLSQMFGPRVAQIVATLTKPPAGSRTHEQVNSEYFPRIQSADDQVRLIKLLDRLDNVRDLLQCAGQEKRTRMAQETQSFYLPLIETMPIPSQRETLRAAFAEALTSAMG